MIPIVNDRTVGKAIKQYHHECRRPRGLYLSIDHADAIEEAFANLGAGPADIDLILERYRNQICTFNDDMQGTGAITLAAAISAVRVCGTPLRTQRVVIFGAGTAGVGIADQIRDAMVREGLSKEDAARRFWCVDRQGLLTGDMAGLLH